MRTPNEDERRVLADALFTVEWSGYDGGDILGIIREGYKGVDNLTNEEFWEEWEALIGND